VIKPDSQGSSLGVCLARDAAELAKILPQSGRFGWPLLAEQYIAGRELTVTVLGRRPLPPVEITGCKEIFDYDSKYSDNTIKCHTPDDLQPITIQQLQSAALGAATALSTSGMVRVDLILDGEGRAWVLEVNTLPGMTTKSLAPKAAQQIGWTLADLCDWMLRDAIE
jgi:D-alanine-D-alanine ligase